MKTRLISILFFTILLFAPTRTLCQRLDIILEGPWVLYEDHSFQNHTGKVDVLIAMAPYGTDHNDPTFSTGDGVTVHWSNVYCVMFGPDCAPKRQAKSLSSDGYYPAAPVTVYTRSGWQWFKDRDPDAMFLILPMPDSYSNNGIDNARFGKTFGSYGSPEKHSIGSVLHYDQNPLPPTTINLYACRVTAGATVVTADDCQDAPFHYPPQDNTGTLDITMRAPEDDDVCSPHVRAAHPKMILLLDPAPILGGNNKNQDKAYIDLLDHNGNTNPGCVDCDPQNPDQSNCVRIMHSEPPPFIDVSKALTGIVGPLSELQEKQQALLYVKELRDQADALKGRYPRLSQLPRMEGILNASANGITELLKERKPTAEVSPTETTLPIPTLRAAKSNERALIAYIRYLLLATSGKDCRAVQMLAQ